MRHFLWIASWPGCCLLLAERVRAADEAPTGNWKVGLFIDGQTRVLWLIGVEKADGKVDLKVLGKISPRAPAITISDVTTTKGVLRFNFKLQGQAGNFEGRIPEGEGKTMYGTFQIGPETIKGELEPTKLKELDPFDLAKEELAKATRPPQVVDAALELIGKAGEKKVKAEEVALVEEEIAYVGGNMVPELHHVVRSFPGGAAGLVLKEKTGKQTVSVDLDELRKSLNKYLTDWAKENDEFPGKMPAIELKKLKVVAFVQNDTTKEVLQAVQVDVK